MNEHRVGATAVTHDPDGHAVTVGDDAGDLLVGTVHAATADGDDGRLQVADVSLSTEARGVVATYTVENVGDEPVRAGDVTLAFETAFGADARVYRHGYQSWSSTGTLPVGERFSPENSDNAPMMNDLAASTDDRVSSYLTGLVEGDRRVTAGFLEHDRYCSRFEIDDDDGGVATLHAVCPLEGARLTPGERLTLPPLWVDADRELREGLTALADCIGERMDARVPEISPTGWCSWYHYFTDVTEADVRENLSELREWGIPVDVVQIDDGYMQAFGDWRSIANGFEDMSAVADDIAASGYRPGCGSRRSTSRRVPTYTLTTRSGSSRSRRTQTPTAREHPSTVASEPGQNYTDSTRRTRRCLSGSGRPCRRLSTTGVHVSEARLPFAAALAGERYDAEATRIEAYRRGSRR